MTIRQKPPKPSFKCYINNILSLFLEVEISMAENFVFRPIYLKGGCARPFYLITGRHVTL